MDEALKKKVDTVIAFCRLGGGVSAIIGTLVLLFFIHAALDPNASITINGISDYWSKCKNTCRSLLRIFSYFGSIFSFFSREIKQQGQVLRCASYLKLASARANPAQWTGSQVGRLFYFVCRVYLKGTSCSAQHFCTISNDFVAAGIALSPQRQE